jgi:hypothetical protein
MITRIVIFALAALLLAAHFLRQGSMVFAVVCLLTPLFFLVRERWSLFVLQAGAYIGTAIWIATAVAIIEERLAYGRSYTAAAAILGAVAAFTLLAGALLNSRSMRERYPPSSAGAQ